MVDDTNDLEKRIRERAFQMWEDAGYPHDRAEEFWLRAEKIELGQAPDGDNAMEPPQIANAVSFAGA